MARRLFFTQFDCSEQQPGPVRSVGARARSQLRTEKHRVLLGFDFAGVLNFCAPKGVHR